MSLVQGIQDKLKALDVDFRSNHAVIVDLTADEDQENEQIILDDYEVRALVLAARIHGLMAVPVPSTISSVSLVAGTKIDICLVQQYEEQVSSQKLELRNIFRDIASLGLDDKVETLPKPEANIKQD